MPNKKNIYLDHAATTPVDPDVLREMLPYFSQKFGNAMSIHAYGREAMAAVDLARKRAADFFGAREKEIIFTSGATEANNLAIRGVVKSYYAKFKKRPHIVATAFEHHCVLDTCHSLHKEGLAEVTYVRPEKDGVVLPSKIKSALRPNSVLVSVMYVNNEIGTVQPVAAIGKMLSSINRKKEARAFPVIFHTDATQAVSYFDCRADKLGVDLLSMSAHKIYGPKGVGLLYVREHTPLKRIQDGGDQEYKLRAGTHNVAGIVGLGKALELVTKSGTHEAKRIRSLRDQLIKRVLKEISGAKLNGSLSRRSPNNANFTFRDVEGEGLLLSLDMEGIAGSTGSACSSGALSPSHVLLSIGLKPEEAHGSLRLTLGKLTNKREIAITIKKLRSVIERLRAVSGNILADYYGQK